MACKEDLGLVDAQKHDTVIKYNKPKDRSS